MEFQGVAISEENFPDKNFRDFISKIYDKDRDGFFSAEEISAVTKIDCVSRYVENLKGIELFPYLKELWCMNNKITELDVSRNTLLQTLICANNRIGSLNVNNCAVLSKLNCSYNRLKELDVSDCITLRFLRTDGNMRLKAENIIR